MAFEISADYPTVISTGAKRSGETCVLLAKPQMRDHRYHVYIVASRSHTLYTGITSALERRIGQHKAGTFEGFSSQYKCNRLVHFETYSDVNRAIAREKQLKGWSRSKKIALIERGNPTWHDLSEDWGKPLRPCNGLVADTNDTQVSPLRFAPVEVTESEPQQINLTRGIVSPKTTPLFPHRSKLPKGE